MSGAVTEHTPGPWMAAGFVVWAPAQKQVIAAASALKPNSGYVEYQRPDVADKDLGVVAANAHLIAAAPDLLEALVNARLALDSLIGIVTELPDVAHPIAEFAERTFGKATAAIAKARGEA